LVIRVIRCIVSVWARRGVVVRGGGGVGGGGGEGGRNI